MGVGDRHQDDVRLPPLEHGFDLGGRPQDLHAVHSAVEQRRVVVDEPEHLLAGRFPELPQQAPSSAPGADDQDAPASRRPGQRAEGWRERPLGQP